MFLRDFRRSLMTPRSVFAVAACAGLLALTAPAAADEYRPDEFLGLDLPTAVLSPKPLGPASRFAPVPVQAKADLATPISVKTTTVKGGQARLAPARTAARTKLAKRHSNPLDAQARDTRVQTWPCRSGGICSWK